MEENFNTPEMLVQVENQSAEGNQEMENIENHDLEVNDSMTGTDANQGFVSGDNTSTEKHLNNNQTILKASDDKNPQSTQTNSNNEKTSYENILNVIQNIFNPSKSLKNNLYTAEECVLASSQNTNIYKYKNGFIFSNTISLLIVAIFTFLYVKNTSSSKMKNFYKSKRIWLLFGLFVIAFCASSTNFPLKFINNYKISVYVNQTFMFITGLIFFHNLISNKED